MSYKTPKPLPIHVEIRRYRGRRYKHLLRGRVVIARAVSPEPLQKRFRLRIRWGRGKRKYVIVHYGKRIVRTISFRTFKPITGVLKTDGFFYPACEIAAKVIMKSKKRSGLVRIRIYGRYGGRQRSLLALTKFSKSTKEYRLRSTYDQRVEFLAKLLIGAIVNKLRSVKTSASPEEKRKKVDKPLNRFFAHKLRFYMV